MFLLIILFLGFSCKRGEASLETSEGVFDTLKLNSDGITYNIGEILIPKAKESLSDWKEYTDVDEFMIKY